ncbi:MAG: TonB family protein [Deltaproteobacteria bacterium]|nr:TonB family protein [Deltaproteobacteria bacterium]MCB9785553.1 TonB family protein [Deltaproteobacteria bacterium]
MAQEGTKKILRVGIIQGGRIVEERLIRKREAVTVGVAAKNTFILPVAGLPKSLTLFDAKGENYQLHFDESMSGRVSVGDAVQDLKALQKSPNVQKRGSSYVVGLDTRSRGKVVIGEFTILFQFVEAPPVLPRPQLPAAARGGIAQRIDWTFVNMLILSFLLQGGAGVGLDIWWRQEGRYLQDEFGERKTRSYEVLKAEVLQQQEIEKEEPEPTEAEPADKEQEAEEPTAEPAPEPEPKKETPKPRVDQGEKKEPAEVRDSNRTKSELKKDVTKKTFLHVLGAEGEDGSLGPSTLKAGLADAKLDEAFQNADGGVANADETTKTTFGGAPVAKAGTGEYKGITKAEAGGERIATKKVETVDKTTATGGEKKVSASVRGGSLTGKTGVGKVDPTAVKSVFARRKGAVQYCYEKALKVNEKLKGKVVIQFTIGPAGRITSISVTENSTGDSSVGQCIMDKVRSWKFTPPEGGSVTFSFPFVLSTGS